MDGDKMRDLLLDCRDFIADELESREESGLTTKYVTDARKLLARIVAVLADDDDDGQPDEAAEWRDYDPDC